MFERRKLLKISRRSPAIKDAYQIDHDKDGRAKIDVGLIDSDDFFSPYSFLTYELMHPGIIDYINMCEAQIPVGEEVSIDVHTEDITTNEEKKRIRYAVKRHHAEQIVLLNKKLKHNAIVGFLYTFLGLAILMFEALLYNVLSQIHILEIIAVIGWLFLWDGLEVLLSDRSEIRRKQIRSYRLLNAKVHIRRYSKKIQRAYGIGDYEEDDE